MNELETNSLIGHEWSTVLALQCGKGVVNKRLEVHSKIWSDKKMVNRFVVLVNNDEIFRTNDLDLAVHKYNKPLP